MLAALWFVRLAARELYGKREGDLSTLAIMGAVGLVWHAHEATAENAMIAGLAAAYYGVAISHRKPYKGALAFGAGAGVAFLAKGLAAAGAAARSRRCWCCRSPRRSASAASRSRSALGLAILAPFVARLAGASRRPTRRTTSPAGSAGSSATSAIRRGSPDSPTSLKTFAWALFPVWPMTLWATWEYRRRLREPGFAVPFVGEHRRPSCCCC